MWDQYVLKPQPWVYFINLIPYCLSKIDNWIKQFWDSSLEIQYEHITMLHKMEVPTIPKGSLRIFTDCAQFKDILNLN